jgi:hypothetical protein
MSARRLPKPQAIDKWHRRPVYRAQIVNSDPAAIVLKSPRSLRVGKRISFARLSDLEQGKANDWRSGVIWRIDERCLHLTRT